MELKNIKNIKCPWCRSQLTKDNILSQKIRKNGKILTHLQCSKCNKYSISFTDVEN